MKARKRRAVAQKMIGKQLERDGLAQFQIISAIDFAHAAFAQQADDAIAFGEHCARHKARIVD